MTEQKKQNDEQARPEAEEESEAPETSAKTQAEAQPDAEAAEDAAPAEDAEGETEGEQDPLAVLREEAASLRDQLLRALAEVENTRRRAQKDKQEAARYAPAPLARDLLAVSDNLGRALESVPEELARDERAKSLIEGIEMTRRELQSVFERHNIAKIEPVGEKLNPHHHEAMFEIEDPNQEPGTVIQVIEPGYVLHDRLLRPARVGVAKGGAKSESKQPANEDAPANDEGEDSAKE